MQKTAGIHHITAFVNDTQRTMMDLQSMNQ